MPRSTLVEQQSAHPPNLMYDNPAAFQVEDFFNLDMLNPQNDEQPSSASSSFSQNPAQSHSGAPSTSSRASSEARTDSPAGSFTHLQTPPEPESIPAFDMTSFGMGMNVDMSVFGGLPPIEEESMFTFPNSEYFKPGTDPLAGLSHAPFDLFGSFDSGLGGATSSSSTSNTSSAPVSNPTTASSSSLPFSIDPQLVGTPAPSASTNSPSDVGAEPDSDSDEARDLVVAPVKVGGKGKARRGTLHSGGVSKKPAPPGPQSIFGDSPSPVVAKSSTKASTTKEKSSAMKDKDLDNDDMKDDMDADDWRPSPEEYQKMSSKEKRQLRNKISARNFRVRRKEYIHTLEGDIADRDRLIDAIRAELGSTKSENSALRSEVAALKKAILAGRASPMLPPPAPLSPLSPLSSFASLPTSSTTSSSNATSNTNTSASTNASSNIIKPNTHKDLPTSPRLAATAGSAFWGGQPGFGFGGGITPVHTTIIPETASAVFGGSNANVDRENENMNPALNGVAPSMQSQAQTQQQAISQVLAQLYGNGNANSNGAGNGNASGAFENFADVNPFTLKTLDAYRMQLWSRVAMQAQAQRARASYPSPSSSPKSSPHSSPSPAPGSPGLQGLASSLRPQYFASSIAPTSPTAGAAGKPPFGALLSGKGLPYAYHGHGSHGLSSPPPSPKVGEKERVQAQGGRKSQTQAQAQMQTHALLATLASQTVLQKMGSAFWDAFSGSGSGVSSSSPGAGPSGTKAWDAEKVRRVLEGTAVLRVVDVERPAAPSAPIAVPAGADALEESMRSLSLGSAKAEKKEDEKEKKTGGIFARMNCGGCSKQ